MEINIKLYVEVTQYVCMLYIIMYVCMMYIIMYVCMYAYRLEKTTTQMKYNVIVYPSIAVEAS